MWPTWEEFFFQLNQLHKMILLVLLFGVQHLLPRRSLGPQYAWPPAPAAGHRPAEGSAEACFSPLVGCSAHRAGQKFWKVKKREKKWHLLKITNSSSTWCYLHLLHKFKHLLRGQTCHSSTDGLWGFMWLNTIAIRRLYNRASSSQTYTIENKHSRGFFKKIFKKQKNIYITLLA